MGTVRRRSRGACGIAWPAPRTEPGSAAWTKRRRYGGVGGCVSHLPRVVKVTVVVSRMLADGFP